VSTGAAVPSGTVNATSDLRAALLFGGGVGDPLGLIHCGPPGRLDSSTAGPGCGILAVGGLRKPDGSAQIKVVILVCFSTMLKFFDNLPSCHPLTWEISGSPHAPTVKMRGGRGKPLPGDRQD